jgi:hypothetical protein
MNYANFFELKGKTITSIDGINSDDYNTVITTSDGTIFSLDLELLPTREVLKFNSWMNQMNIKANPFSVFKNK